MQPISQFLSVAVSGNTLRGQSAPQLPELEGPDMVWEKLKEPAEPQLPRARAHASAEAKSSSGDEEPIHPDGLDCGDGTFVHVNLDHVHVQDFSASFNQKSKQKPLVDSLLKSTERFYSAFGPDAYRLTLVNGTDKNVNQHNPNEKHRFCNETYFDSHEFSSQKLDDVKSELESIIYDESRYWQNGARPDLLDAIYDIAMATDKEDSSVDTIRIFTVGTDQCASESCIYLGEQQPSVPEEFKCVHRKVPEKIQESWANDRRMGIKNCNERDYMSLYELAYALEHANAKLLWLLDSDANLGTMCQEVGGITVTDYYERRLNTFLQNLGQTSVTYNVSEGGDALSDGIIDGIKELVCHPPTTIAPPPDFLTTTTVPPEVLSTTAHPPEVLSTTAAKPEVLSTTAAKPEVLSTTAPPPEVLSTTTPSAPTTRGPVISTELFTTGSATELIPCKPDCDCATKACGCCPKNGEAVKYLRKEVEQLRKMLLGLIDETTTTQSKDVGPIVVTTQSKDVGPIEETTTTQGIDGGPIDFTTQSKDVGPIVVTTQSKDVGPIEETTTTQGKDVGPID